MTDLENRQKESEVLAKLVAQGMDDKKGVDIRILDLRGIASAPASFFVICSGNVPSHVSAIADGVYEVVRKAIGQKPHRIEGYDNAEWILMDYFDVVVHVFIGAKRDFYRLEELWADAEIMEYGKKETSEENAAQHRATKRKK
ncbi:MAG: ribosome silencing factor [Bacteroidales bacterium]|nr:ribosome silencing factor [Bacteroidales bacterium]